MGPSVLKFVRILLLVAAISLPYATTTHAEAPSNAEGAEETQEMNCCKKMEKMKKEMQPIMDNQQMIKNEMKTLFKELQQSGKLTKEQIKKMKNIEQMMEQMGKMMK